MKTVSKGKKGRHGPDGNVRRTAKLAVIGAGRMGTIHAESVARNPRAELLYVNDIIPEREDVVAERHGATAADKKTIFADPAVDGVIIATPTPVHKRLILAASSAGKAIFCEKPPAMTLAEMLGYEKSVLDSGAPFMLGFQRRFDPVFESVREAAPRNVGHIEHVHIVSRDPYSHPPDVMEESSSIFGDAMIHDANMALSYLADDDTVVRIAAVGSCLVAPLYERFDDFAMVQIIFRTRKGIIGDINCSRRDPRGYIQHLSLSGDRGTVDTDGYEGRLETEDSGDEAPFFAVRYRAAYANEIDHYVRVILDGECPRTGLREGIRTMRFVEAAEHAARHNTVVTVEI